MRVVAQVTPTKHVLNLVEFAEEIIRMVGSRGLYHVKRKYKRRKGKKAKQKATSKPPKGKKKAAGNHPLAATGTEE